MSFLLDTDTCSFHLKRPSGLIHRFQQYSGNLFISTISMGELYTWAYRRKEPTSLLVTLECDLLKSVTVLDYDLECAKVFGQYRGQLLQSGINIPTADMMNAAIALYDNLTLVTHNTRDYQSIPNLRLEDWLIP